MIYNDRLTPPNNWPPLVRQPSYSYYPDRRLSILWFLALAIVSLTLSVAALIIVFAVEHSWFHDNYSNTTIRYGLWRLCFQNDTCDSWFATSGNYSNFIGQRLDASKAGINAWQALEIIFLFLTTSALLIAISALVCYRIRHSLHYYLAILAVFCVWPAVCIGISALFVFGFAVYNISATPRDLDWCFYVNLVAVILAFIGAILLSIYDTLFRKPIKNVEDDVVTETFADLNGYPAALSPSTFVIVRRNKNKRNKPYDYPQVLHPSHYFPTQTTANDMVTSGGNRTDYIPNANHQTLTPYTSIVSTHETNTTLQKQQPPVTPYRSFNYDRSDLVTSPSSTTIAPHSSIPIQPQTYRTQQPPYQYQANPTPPQTYRTQQPPYQYQPDPSPAQWHRAGTNTMNQSVGYASEATNDYNQRGVYYPTRSNRTDRSFEQKPEPRVLHYYTGYDYFATVDPSDAVSTRHYPTTTGPGSAIRYNSNPPYHQQNDYIKSTM